MAIKITKKAKSSDWPFPVVHTPPAAVGVGLEPLPWEDAQIIEQTLLEALKEYAALPVKTSRKLFILHRVTHTEYQVKGYDPETMRVNLIGPNHAKLKPIVGTREDPLYTVVWR